MAKKNRPLFEDDEPELDISSLIDVCFLLLIYFIVTSQIQPEEKDLPMTTPSSAPPSDQKSEVDPILIVIQESGQIMLNKTEALDAASVGRERKLPQLNTRLAEISEMSRATGKEPVVQVYVYDSTAQEQVIDVLNCLKGNSINIVTFNDTPPQ